jgi:hypothetical protein
MSHQRSLLAVESTLRIEFLFSSFIRNDRTALKDTAVVDVLIA